MSRDRNSTRIAIPVIGSLNGTTTEEWLGFARLIERAGADALELKFYHLKSSVGPRSTATRRWRKCGAV